MTGNRWHRLGLIHKATRALPTAPFQRHVTLDAVSGPFVDHNRSPSGWQVGGGGDRKDGPYRENREWVAQ